jgi:hypothetical protein
VHSAAQRRSHQKLLEDAMSNGSANLSLNFAEAARDGDLEFFFDDDVQAKLAARLNALINLPFLPESVEGQIILKVIQSLDRNIFKYIPKEILEIALDRKKGLPSGYLEVLRSSLPDLLAGLIPLPFLPSFLKAALIGQFVNLLIEALKSGNSLKDLLDGR